MEFNFPNHILVVKTNLYAGSFERVMCAFMTGCIGDCEVGRKQSESFIEDFGDIFEHNIQRIPDDSGCHRPCSIGDDKNEVAIFFHKPLDYSSLSFLRSRAEEFAEITPHMVIEKIYTIDFNYSKIVTTFSD